MLTIELNEPKTTRGWRTTTRQHHYPHDKPAYTGWYEKGQKHCEAYYLNGYLHRENDKPAITHWQSNGQKCQELYYLNGILYTPKEPTC